MTRLDRWMRTCRRQLLVALPMLLAFGCGESRSIPARGDAPGPERFLVGGTKVFIDDFERPSPGDNYTTTHAGWRIEGGWLHSTQPKNEGLWLKKLLPEGRVRIEFDARSESLPAGKPFPGDLKCEAFATTPVHQAGYVFINGGWDNSLDVIARLEEHGDAKAVPGAARIAQASKPVAASKVYRYAVIRDGATFHWLRDGALLMSYTDRDPIPGRYFGFNNWATNAYFDNLAIYDLSALK